ncbi:nucleoid occlusion factor SlmA [Limnohabitans sp. TEGF004]|uniref:nucleoid occlusion factor SlmA n=1 Tax=Limnohabitans sp. TEGF004 TaxID=2986281 RepID=UPI0023779FCD|nr:nucleoid occlusion factor SlmA [Limnohabitans sp. TEGF004]BDU54597.1 nucleoid occlusion factor SlmA [Limnohabitans sp. TEGF004]
MSEHAPATPDDHAAAEGGQPKVRQRMKPGQRREQILQTLAGMLEQPGTERITTALLASKLDVSEAALYRHFASKAQMFEGLIDFIEHSLFSLINQIAEREGDGAQKAARMVTVLLQFGEKNPGMARVMVGDALVFEDERLHQRMNQLFERIESALRQVLRVAAEANKSATPTADAQVRAAALAAFALGQLQRFARSGFKRSPLDHLEASLALMR